MTDYVWQDGRFRDKRTGEAMHLPYAGQVVAPRVMSDIPDYHSPIDGRVIGSRSARREDLRRNNCHEVDPPKAATFVNKRFCEKWGLPHTPVERAEKAIGSTALPDDLERQLHAIAGTIDKPRRRRRVKPE